ncbi:MAG: hypothetical protein ACRDVM_00455 [Acidimicrobiia bacterium]
MAGAPELCDRDEMLDAEYRTARRRLLIRVAAGNLAAFRRRARPDTAVAGVLWIVAKANDLFSPSAGGTSFCAAIGTPACRGGGSRPLFGCDECLAALLEELAFAGGVGGERKCGVVGGCRFPVAAEAFEQVGPGGVARWYRSRWSLAAFGLLW